MTTNTPIILLGRHGAGKDTMAGLLKVIYTGVFNAKFSEYSKRFVASALDIPYEYLNDREKRNDLSATGTFGFTSDFSALDMLNVIYYGSLGDNPESKRFCEAGIRYTLSKAEYSPRVVFTDIRRLQEAEAVLQYYDRLKVIVLVNNGAIGERLEPSDSNLPDLISSLYSHKKTECHTIYRSAEDTPHKTFVKLQTLLDWRQD